MAAKRVLLVEDDGLVRALAAESLRDEGFEVVEAPDGDDAARQLQRPANFDILFTDVRLPSDLDGIQVAAYARKLAPDISVVIVSGYAPELTERLQNLPPPFIFLRKPYRISQILDAINKLAA